MFSKGSYCSFIKPFFDYSFAGFLALLSSPLFVIISLGLVLHQVPVFFIHQRPGFQAGSFGMMKFTTMRKGRSSFAFGGFLRKTSLDELPQLINVLKGEMSFVGPRPLLTEYLDDLAPASHPRYLVKPGITGLAQVNGRNSLPLEEKLAYDEVYVRKISFLTDFKILMKTIAQVFKFSESDYHKIERG